MIGLTAVMVASWLSIADSRPISGKDIEQPAVFAPPTEKDAALVLSFLGHEDRRIRSESAWTLGDSRINEMNPELARHLSVESNHWVRADVLHAMGKFTDLQDPVAVVAGLSDPAPPSRFWSLWTLAEWEATATVAAVAERAAKDDSEAVRARAAETLGRFPVPQAEAALVATMKDPSARVRQAAARALGNFDEPSEDSLKAALEALKDNDPLVRAAAVAALGKVTNFPVEAPVAEMASDDYQVVRKQVAVSLRALRATERTQTTIGLLNDSDMSVRIEAAATLASFKTKDAITPLLLRINDRDKFVRRAAARALVDLKMADDIVPKLVIQLDNASEAARREAAWALGEYRDKRATFPLIKVVADTDVETSINAIQALGKTGDRLAVETLIGELKNQMGAKRAMAAWSLGEIRDKRATLPLISTLKDSEYEPRLEAATAAGKINDAEFVKPLIEVLQNVSSEQFPTRGAAAWSLGLIGDARAVARLRQMVSEKVIPTPFGPVYDHDSVRMNSAIALSKIARVLQNAGQRPTIAAFLEEQFNAQDSSDNLRECVSECLFVLTNKRFEFTRRPPSPKQYFVRSIEGKE